VTDVKPCEQCARKAVHAEKDRRKKAKKKPKRKKKK